MWCAQSGAVLPRDGVCIYGTVSSWRCGGRRGAEHFGEARVFVDADCHIDYCCCEEFGEACIDGVVGLIVCY